VERESGDLLFGCSHGIDGEIWFSGDLTVWSVRGTEKPLGASAPFPTLWMCTSSVWGIAPLGISV
jgi:hypothetical protein